MPDLRNTDIQYLPGVGPKRAELLKKELGIHSFHDLLYYFPFRHIDRSTIHRICEIDEDMPYIQLRGRFITFTTAGNGPKKRLQALFTDGSGTIEVVWFNRVKQIQESLHTGIEYILFGKPSEYKHQFNLVHPEVDSPSESATQGGMRGVYSLTEKVQSRGITSRVMQRLVATLLQQPAAQTVDDPLPESLRARRGLMPLRDALAAMHLPTDTDTLRRARLRMKYEELFFLQLNILRYIKGDDRRQNGHKLTRVGAYFNRFYREVLPFALTDAQKRVVREIWTDLTSGRQMNRLLQGDVGSGKTIVALMTALLAIDNGYQACIMAPTEILATQHYEEIARLIAPLGLNAGLLKGSTRTRARRELHERMLDGSMHITIGTHALIEPDVQWKNLGIAIIDEQHRFGVAQRARLWEKNTLPPHVLVMTATPIPRTLAMTVYGDLDVSVIDQLPPGRKPVTTMLRYDADRQQMYHFVGQQLRQGRQIYFVYPLIEENEKLDLRDLEQGYQNVCEIYPHYNVAFVHGRMRPAEKDAQMQRFVSAEAQIMVATTVIEVGVNVPNASVMVIENAERFGLSQLHQLRGRVGRGADQSFCILMSKHQLSRETRHRLNVMTQTNDGFRVAEEDMQLRGPGDIEGTQQSGIAFNLRVANLAQDGQIVQLTRDDAQRLLQSDPTLATPEGQRLDQHLHTLYDKTRHWNQIS